MNEAQDLIPAIETGSIITVMEAIANVALVTQAPLERAIEARNLDVMKTAISLSYLQHDTNSLFSRLPVEYLVKIASMMGNDPNKIEDDKYALLT